MTVDQRIEFLLHSNESHDRQIGELIGQMGELTSRMNLFTTQMSDLKDAVSKLVQVSNEDATAIRALARIADAHENRISRLETKQ